MMLIYTLTNLVNGKQYVGLTTTSLATRWKRHVNKSVSCKTKRSYIMNAIAKYGKENFKIEKVDTADSYEELSQKETEWINKLNTLWPNGYNLMLYDGVERVITSSTRKKCANGGKRTWENARKDPKKMRERVKILKRAGERALIKNKERVGEKVREHTSSEFVGVCKSGRKNKPWKGYYTDTSGKQVSKRFASEKEAAMFYNENTQRIYGSVAKLNSINK